MVEANSIPTKTQQSLHPMFHLPIKGQSLEAICQGTVYFLQMLAAAPFSAIHALLHGRSAITQFLHRYGCYPSIKRGSSLPTHIVLYCHSIGELRTAVPFVERLQDRHPEWELSLLVKAFEPYETAHTLLPNIRRVMFVPLDAPFFVARALRFLRPDAILTIENDLRYHLVAQAKHRGIATFYLGAELSGRGKMKMSPALYSQALNSTDVITVRDDAGWKKVRTAGATEERVFISGNLRFDANPPCCDVLEPHLADFIAHWKAQGPIFVAGSTYAEEETIILDTLKRLRQTFPSLRTILAPRRTARAGDTRQLALDNGFSAQLRSALLSEDSHDTEILIIDTMGELRALYGSADISFIGGSLVVNRGGHNIIEAADHGVPCLFGESIYTNPEISTALLQRDCAWIVHNAEELAERITFLLENPDTRKSTGERCRQVVRDLAGATDFCLKLLDEVMAQRTMALKGDRNIG